MSRALGLAGLILTLVLFAAPANAGTLPKPSRQCGPSSSPSLVQVTQQAQKDPWAQHVLDYSNAWKYSEGQGVKVAVIDSGVDANSQFGNRVTLAAPRPGQANGNGDCVGHGTMVAGIIGASPAPGTEFAGVAPEADIESIKVTNGEDANVSTPVLVQAVGQAIADGAQVINISLGTLTNDPSLKGVIEYALQHNIVVVASAGNDQKGEKSPFFPASYPGVLSVGAVDATGALAPFSDRYSDAAVTAPGTDVTSTFPGRSDSYVAADGTGYAAAFVSGLAALVRSRNPTMTAQRVVQQIEETANGSAGSGTGNGLINPVQAVTAVVPARGFSSHTPVQPSAAVFGIRQSPKGWNGVIYAMGISVGAFVVLAILILVAVLMISPFRRGWRMRARTTPREPQPPAQPPRLRSLRLAPLSSILVAVAVAGVFGILQVLSPGNASGLNQPGTLATDSRTGTLYVPCDTDELCPSINETSALLALNSTSVNRVTVNDSALAQHRRGPVIGIPGIPQQVPAPSSLVRGPWAVCTQQSSAASGTYTSSALVGGQAVGGSPLQGELLVSPGPGSDWILQDGHRSLVAGADAASFIKATRPFTITVPPAWLDTIPEGPDFHASALFQAKMIAGANTSVVPGRANTLCVSIRPGSGPQITTDGTVPGDALPVNRRSRSTTGVDKVWLPTGKSALIGAASNAGQPASGWSLVTGTTRYTLDGSGVARMLGYNLTADQAVLPASWLWLLPQGPGLDPTAASQALKVQPRDPRPLPANRRQGLALASDPSRVRGRQVVLELGVPELVNGAHTTEQSQPVGIV